MNFKYNPIYKFLINIFLILIMLPILILILWSFTISWPWPKLLPNTFDLRAFKYLFSINTGSLNILCFSIVLSLSVTIITILISIPGGKALGLYDFKGKKLIQMLTLAPLIVPPISVAMGIHIIFIRLNLANTFLGVVLVHLIPCLPYGIRILSNTFEMIGESMELQAKVLGAGSFYCFIYITLPLIAPGLVAAASMVFIISFSQYFLTFLIGGGNVITFSIAMFPFIQSGDRSMASAYSLVFIFTTLILLLAVEKVVKKYYKSQSHFYL